MCKSFPALPSHYLFSLFVRQFRKKTGIVNSRVPGDKRSEVMIGVADYDAAAQVEEAQVAAFNHRPPHLINGHAELKLVRDPH